MMSETCVCIRQSMCQGVVGIGAFTKICTYMPWSFMFPYLGGLYLVTF